MSGQLSVRDRARAISNRLCAEAARPDVAGLEGWVRDTPPRSWSVDQFPRRLRKEIPVLLDALQTDPFLDAGLAPRSRQVKMAFLRQLKEIRNDRSIPPSHAYLARIVPAMASAMTCGAIDAALYLGMGVAALTTEPLPGGTPFLADDPEAVRLGLNHRLSTFADVLRGEGQKGAYRNLYGLNAYVRRTIADIDGLVGREGSQSEAAWNIQRSGLVQSCYEIGLWEAGVAYLDRAFRPRGSSSG